MTLLERFDAYGVGSDNAFDCAKRSEIRRAIAIAIAQVVEDMRSMRTQEAMYTAGWIVGRADELLAATSSPVPRS